jgi:hypothetical protein
MINTEQVKNDLNTLKQYLVACRLQNEISEDSVKLLFKAIDNINYDFDTVKKVNKEEMNEFFKKSFPYKEIYTDSNNEYWKITYSLNQMETVLKYWEDKGYFRFINLLLIFER